MYWLSRHLILDLASSQVTQITESLQKPSFGSLCAGHVVIQPTLFLIQPGVTEIL